MDVESKKMGVGEIFSTGWKTFFSSFSDMIMIGLLFWVPYVIIQTVLLSSINLNNFQTIASLGNIIQILFGLVYVIATVAIIYIAHQRVMNKPVTWKEALSFGFSKWGVALGGSIVIGLAIFGLLLLLIIPAIIFGVYWTFFIYSLVLKDMRIGEAMKYSKSLVKGRWWRLFFFLLSMGVVLSIIMMVVMMPFSSMMSTPVMNIIGFIVGYLLSFIVNGIILSVITVMFVNWSKFGADAN